ncbi:LuxR family transcriptional regulator [Agrobacterium sp. CR_3]|uniref:helix-turn-helix transcriptional regulator n=1 Tax=unclassified Agrobacterium TaxID=2632611 RepID=UPI0035BEED99
MDFIFSTMAKETPFSAVTRTMIDNWLQTSPEDVARPEAVYNDILGHLSIKMRLTLFTVTSDNPKKWHMKAIRHSGFTSRILNINKIFADCYVEDFKDQKYMEDATIPRLRQVMELQPPSMELVKTRLFGVNLDYDRILIPQKNRARPQWGISSSYAQFLLSSPPQHEKLVVAYEAMVQLSIEGATAKEIAETLGASPRTVEHRIERLKISYGARHTLHLIAVLVTAHAENMAEPTSG